MSVVGVRPQFFKLAPIAHAAYRGGVKETAFSGVFDTVRHLAEVGAIASVHDPLYGDDKLRELGLTPHSLDTCVEAAVLHTNHAEYRSLSSAHLPDVKVILDGRMALPSEFRGAQVQYIGFGWAQ